MPCIGLGRASLRLGAGQAAASVLIAAFTVLNCFGVGRTAARCRTCSPRTKIVVIAAFIIVGLRFGTGDWSHFSEPAVRTSTAPLPDAVRRQPALGDGRLQRLERGDVHRREKSTSPERTLPRAPGCRDRDRGAALPGPEPGVSSIPRRSKR